MRLPSSLDALRERDFRLVFLASTASLLGDRLVPVAIAFATLDLTGSAADLGYVLAAGWGPQIALLLVGGVLSDRLARRTVMLAADVARAGSQALLAALLLSGDARLWHLLVLQAMRGAATAFFNPASTGLVPQTVSFERLQPANALRGLVMWTSGIVGPGLGGGLVAAVGPGAAIAVDAATFLWSAAFLVRVHVPALERPGERTSPLRDLVDGWRAFVANTWVWAIVVASAFGNGFVNAPFDVLGPAIVKERYGGAGAWGVIGACAGVGAVVAGLSMLRLRPRRPLFVASILILATLPRMALLAAGLPLAAVAAASVVAGAGYAIFGVLWETALQRHVAVEALARVSAYDWLGSLALIPVGTVAAGAAGGAVGDATALWGAVVVGVVANGLVLVVPSIRNLRDQ